MKKYLLTILVLCVCCSNAVFQRCRSVPVPATIPVCPSRSVVIYGNQCCPAKDYYEVSSLGCKGAWKSAGNSGVCPYGQSMFWIFDERYCCDNKDIYDSATASCHAGGVLGAAINGHCATNFYISLLFSLFWLLKPPTQPARNPLTKLSEEPVQMVRLLSLEDKIAVRMLMFMTLIATSVVTETRSAQLSEESAQMDSSWLPTSIEASTLTTHCVMKTDENGVLVTDNTNLLFWIFNGSIIVKEQWMIDCIQDQKLIQQDFKYLIEKVQFKGVLYDTVLQWSEAMAKGDVPYLYGVQVAIAMKACSNIVTLSALITNHGGILLDQFPDKSIYNSGSHPYMHSHLGPLFVLHDDETDLSKFKNDKMFTLFTEDEFIAFMLRRDIKKDSSENPICVLREQE
ncbi:hypothetical protein CRE_06413 [Caenorhabditis remanei]|uniref:BRCT domain-containing protein n=1 Tax=Caenorhabditis remanei TaxID=31234 RepID=E3M0T1_CAERE|nr:hypothetical protein CRE_06413 [Caenorhabditis remanei]